MASRMVINRIYYGEGRTIPVNIPFDKIEGDDREQAVFDGTRWWISDKHNAVVNERFAPGEHGEPKFITTHMVCDPEDED